MRNRKFHSQKTQGSATMKSHLSVSPRFLCQSLWNNGFLIRSLIVRQISQRYKASYLGPIWYLISPIFLLSIYTFVFSGVFHARWGSAQASPAEFALNIYAGLVIINCFNEILTTSAGLVSTSPNFVKKTFFPLHVLAVVAVAVALFGYVINLSILCAYYFYLKGSIPWLALLSPIYLSPLFLAMIGMAWLFSAAGVFLRDLTQAVTFLSTVLVFMTPIFYSASSVPEKYRSLVAYNPLAWAVETNRAVILDHTGPDLLNWTLTFALSMAFAWFCFFAFQRLRKGFADVL
jgi:lipopolysaccharide transport system permease protein